MAAGGDGAKLAGAAGQEQTGVLTSPDGKVSNIPSGMIRDQFGMIGMLTFLRALETDPSIVSFALGTELTHLGLNLNAAGWVFVTGVGTHERAYRLFRRCHKQQ